MKSPMVGFMKHHFFSISAIVDNHGKLSLRGDEELLAGTMRMLAANFAARYVVNDKSPQRCKWKTLLRKFERHDAAAHVRFQNTRASQPLTLNC